MQIERMGFILKTPLVAECIAFYRGILEFPIWFQNDSVTCIGIGSSYILIESPDADDLKPPGDSVVVRLNVADVESEAKILQARGVAAWVDHFEWGTICTFFDPAGTKLELMEAKKFRGVGRRTGNSDVDHSSSGPVED